MTRFRGWSKLADCVLRILVPAYFRNNQRASKARCSLSQTIYKISVLRNLTLSYSQAGLKALYRWFLTKWAFRHEQITERFYLGGFHTNIVKLTLSINFNLAHACGTFLLLQSLLIIGGTSIMHQVEVYAWRRCNNLCVKILLNFCCRLVLNALYHWFPTKWAYIAILPEFPPSTWAQDALSQISNKIGLQSNLTWISSVDWRSRHFIADFSGESFSKS